MRKVLNILLYSILTIVSLTSCGSVVKVKSYRFSSADLPAAFDSCRVAFVSDLHYKSLLNERRLHKLVSLLKRERPDMLLLGGDYQEGCEYVVPLFSELGTVNPPLGCFGVLGNNDYERCRDEIANAMDSLGFSLLEHRTDTVRRGGDYILVSGVRDPFDLKNNGVSPTLSLSPSDFVILLTHTPDYAEDVSVANADIVLAGHTHGGQVRLLWYAPLTGSHYGRRFLHGMRHNSAGVPVIITNGVGTSRRNIRIGARAEVVILTLYSAERYSSPDL